MPKLFHYLSYSKWIFLVVGLFYAFGAQFINNESLFSNVGYSLYLMGIGLVLGSMTTTNKLSKGEIKSFSDPRKFKLAVIVFSVSIFLTICSALYLLLAQNIKPDISETIANSAVQVGQGALAFALGLLFELKLLFEKKEIYLKDYSEK